MGSDAASPDISSAYQQTHTFWQHDAAFTGGVAYSQPARTATRWSRPTAYRALGTDHTVYTDPSGFDPSTVSAADQLRVFQRAMRFPVFRPIVAMPSVTLPIAGTLTNFNDRVSRVGASNQDGYSQLLAPVPRARTDVNANDHPRENA
jgi:hypothetical protein